MKNNILPPVQLLPCFSTCDIESTHLPARKLRVTRMHILLLCPLLLCFISVSANAASGFQAKQAVVVAAQEDAVQAGSVMLQQGGNAFDAAAAVALTLGVVEPGSSGIGGGGFFLLYIADEDRYVMIDARETSPRLAGHGEVYDHYSSVDGPKAAGVPGLLAGIDHLLARYGQLHRKEVAAPAIKLAEQGFMPEARLQSMLTWRSKVFNPAARAVFLAQDTRIHQPALAATLKRYVQHGVDDFYRGETARLLLKDLKRDGGLIRADDLAQYRAIERKPVTTTWQGYQLISASLPSSGGIVLAEILGMLASDDLAAMPPLDQKILLIEAMRRAYRDRNQYLGDDNFITIPDLLQTERLKKLRASINLQQATPSDRLGNEDDPAGNGQDTTHFSIIDQQGNMVVATLSINYGFGSGYLSASTGILLNDEMDDFATRPGKPNAYGLVQGEANAVAPGKRMLSSMTPTIVLGPERLWLVGTPGGSRIISMVLLASMGFMQHRGNADQWVQAPRFHHQFLPDVVQYEQGAFSPSEIKTLKKRGFKLKKVRDYGNMQAIVCNRKEQSCLGVTDRRGEGVTAMVK